MSQFHIGNLNTDEFVHACIRCESVNGICSYAFRNTGGRITGFIFICEDCSAHIEDFKMGVFWEI